MSTSSGGGRNSSRRNLVAFLVVSILLLIAFGALAAPRGQDRDRDRAFVDRDHLWVSRERAAFDFGGGNGGRPSPDALCEPDSVAIGFHVQTGEYINTAWLDCAPIREGHLADEARPTGRTGSPGGRPVTDAFCPGHMVLRGLRGRTGASIDEAAGVCSPLHEVADRNPNPHTELTQWAMRPHPAGHPSEALCPPGSVVTGFRSTSGEYMDHLWIVCSELRREHRDDDRR